MEFLDFVKTALGKSFVIQGRSQRKEYWYFVLAMFVVQFCVTILSSLLVIADMDIFALLGALVILCMLPAGLTVSIRRLHDIGRTGWWLLIAFIPLVGAIVMIIFAVQDSQPGDNQYGPNPKGVMA